jgi:hypothetical protein
MTPGRDSRERIDFLARVVKRECRHLSATDQRLFSTPIDASRASSLADDEELAERVEAFVSRFTRLQDTLGGKLLPALLDAFGEPSGLLIDHLDRAERLGWIESAERWMQARSLRMVHEYVEDPLLLASAIGAGHAYVPVLLRAAEAMLGAWQVRGSSTATL